MNVLTVVLTPDEGAAEILDVLHDLSGADLLERFCWVPAAGMTGSDLRAFTVEGGRRRPTTLQDSVIGERPERVRLCVLVPLAATASPLSGAVEQEVATALAANAGGAPVTRFRALLTRGGNHRPAPEDVAREGWHNVLLAPERSSGPRTGRWALPESVTPDEAARHLAPSLAGLAGLWKGVPACVLDDMPVPAGRSVRTARGFYRRVEAPEVERELRSRVLATRPTLPLPLPPYAHRGSMPATVYLKDAGAACATMARNLWAKHAYMITEHRRPAPGPSAPAVTWRTALGWFPSYLRWASVDRPDRWYANTVLCLETPHEQQAQTFAALPPTYTTIVTGTRPDGLAADWHDLGDVVTQTEAVLPPLTEPRPHVEEFNDLTALWQDYVGGALTLADAGDRGGQAMPATQAGPSRGVLRSTSDCAPGPEGDLVLAHGNVAAVTEITSLQAGDVLGADALRRRLTPLAHNHTFTGDVDRTWRQLADWQNAHQATYVHHVGARLADRVEAVGTELRDHLAALAEAARPAELTIAQRQRQQVLSRLVALIGGLAVLVTLLTVLGMVVFGASAGALLFVLIALVLGTLGTAAMYGLGQRPLFSEVNRRHALIARVEAEQRNLREALREYRQLHDAYADFLVWSRAVAAVLAEPFGRDDGRLDTPPPAVRGLAPSTRIGRAVVDPSAMPVAATTLRSDLFVTGWLTGPWQSNLADAVARYAPGGADSGAPPELVLGARSQAREDPPLWAWAEHMTADGPTSTVGDQAWAAVMGSLTGQRAEVGVALLAAISDASVPAAVRAEAEASTRAGTSEGAATESLSAFMAGVDLGPADDRVEDRVHERGHLRAVGDATDRWATRGGPVGSSASGPTSTPFDPSHFTAGGQAAERGSVAGSAPAGVRYGLSRIDVLVEYGDAFPAWDLEVGDRAAESPGISTVGTPTDSAESTNSAERRAW